MIKWAEFRTSVATRLASLFNWLPPISSERLFLFSTAKTAGVVGETLYTTTRWVLSRKRIASFTSHVTIHAHSQICWECTLLHVSSVPHSDPLWPSTSSKHAVGTRQTTKENWKVVLEKSVPALVAAEAVDFSVTTIIHMVQNKPEKIYQANVDKLFQNSVQWPSHRCRV